MTTVHLPASITEAAERLGAIERLLTARGWERAATVAAFVRLAEGPGRNVTSDLSLSPDQFAALGIAGLRSKNTVQLYVQRWLDAHDGIYPEPGAEVVLPEDDWPPTRTGTNGANSEAGMEATLAAMTERHGPDAVADAIVRNDGEVAERIEERQAHARATARPESERSAAIRDRFQNTADEAEAAYNEASEGTRDAAAAEVRRISTRLATLRMFAEPTTDLTNNVVRLATFLDHWKQELTGSGSVSWSEDDRAFASELGIDLEGVRG